MLKAHVVDTSRITWQPGSTEGLTFRCQVLIDGAEGPEAMRFRFDPCPSVYAHMHLTSQFQLLLDGGMNMPRGRMDLVPLAVHYTDHNVPYGPFQVLGNHDMLVLHPRRGGLVPLFDPVFRTRINLGGRLLVATAEERDWGADPRWERTRVKTLFAGESGPEALIVDAPAGTELELPPPVFGRYEVVTSGSMIVDGESLVPPGLRYVEGDKVAPPCTAGPDGATIVLLSFDRDANEGGLRADDELTRAAVDALARAI